MLTGKFHSNVVSHKIDFQMCRDTLKSSREYTGKGQATYPNGDIYDGQFVDGVSLTHSYITTHMENFHDCFLYSETATIFFFERKHLFDLTYL